MKRLIFLVFIILTAISIAHSGRTDGHRYNNNRSGLGPYHYHHGYSAHLHKNNMSL